MKERKRRPAIEELVERVNGAELECAEARSGRYVVATAIGASCRATRVELGRSLRAVAKRMRVSAPYLSDLELGRRVWSEELLKRWREAL